MYGSWVMLMQNGGSHPAVCSQIAEFSINVLTQTPSIRIAGMFDVNRMLVHAVRMKSRHQSSFLKIFSSIHPPDVWLCDYIHHTIDPVRPNGRPGDMKILLISLILFRCASCSFDGMNPRTNLSSTYYIVYYQYFILLIARIDVVIHSARITRIHTEHPQPYTFALV